MPTPRSEAIMKARSGEAFIREPVSKYDTENKIDHYGVLSQVINSGIDKYLSNPDYHSTLDSAHSIPHLDANLRADINEVVLATLQDAEFSAHHDNLIKSAESRSTLNENLWFDINNNITAGVGTFVSTTSYLFSILKSRLGPEVAAHESNWTILDKLAKQNLTAFTAYYRTYFIIHENWSQFIEQIEANEDGGYRFKPGYPANTLVNNASTSSLHGTNTSSKLILNENNPTKLLKDIELQQATIGCPITFEPGVVEKLWTLYATQAHRHVTTPPINL